MRCHGLWCPGAERYADLACDIVSTYLDLVFPISTRLALNFKMADPTAGRLVPSLARPGGNITGVRMDARLQILGKRLWLLVEATQNCSSLVSAFHKFVDPMEDEKVHDGREPRNEICQA